MLPNSHIVVCILVFFLPVSLLLCRHKSRSTHITTRHICIGAWAIHRTYESHTHTLHRSRVETSYERPFFGKFVHLFAYTIFKIVFAMLQRRINPPHSYGERTHFVGIKFIYYFHPTPACLSCTAFALLFSLSVRFLCACLSFPFL